MDSLVNLQPVKPENDIKSLRFLYDKIMSHIRALQALILNLTFTVNYWFPC